MSAIPATEYYGTNIPPATEEYDMKVDPATEDYVMSDIPTYHVDPHEEQECNYENVDPIKRMKKNLRKARSELKNVYEEDNATYLEAEAQGDRTKMAVILHRWKASVRKYVLRLVRYCRKVETISPSQALQMHEWWSIKNMQNLRHEHKDYLLALYPPELIEDALRAEEITANFGKEGKSGKKNKKKKKKAEQQIKAEQ
jgi:hypothetical protein